MKPRIESIFKVDCKDHSDRPIQSCDYLNNFKLVCSACQKQQAIQIPLENISKDIKNYYNTAKVQRENGIKQLEAFINKIQTYFKTFLQKMDEDLRTIRQSIVEMKYFEEIEQQWIYDTTSSVSREDLTNLVKIWNGIYQWDENQSKIRESFKENINNMLQKIKSFSDNLNQYGQLRQVRQVPLPGPVDNSIIIQPVFQPPPPYIQPTIQRINLDAMRIDRLLNLEQQLRKFEMYNVCHFKVLQSCRLKQFLMPPVTEDVTMIFGFHNKINQQPLQTQEFNILKNSEAKFYSVNFDVSLEKDQSYTLSLQLKDQLKTNFQIQLYSQNAPKNEYFEFIDQPQIYTDWGRSNQFYFSKGLFSSLMIE